MFFHTLRRLCSAAMTDSVVTHSPGSRGVHRPKGAMQAEMKQRRRQRRLQRGRNIAAKESEVQRSIEGVTSSRDLLVGQLADQIFARGQQHVASAMNVGFVPDGNPATPLVALAGREGCGKTSLLRSLFRSAREVGRSNRLLRRDAMNFFNVGDVFNVADLPGCGGTAVPWSAVLQHAVLLRNFARCQPSLKMLYYCMDVHYKHGVYIQDIDLLRFLSREVPNFTIVITKADQINDRAVRTAHMDDIRKELLYNDIHHPVLVTSAFHMGGVDTLRYDMVMNCLHALPTERLTLTEARRLSARLFSQKELSTVRHLAIAPSQVEDERQAWLEDIRRTEQQDMLAAALPVEVEDVIVGSTTFDNSGRHPATALNAALEDASEVVNETAESRRDEDVEEDAEEDAEEGELGEDIVEGKETEEHDGVLRYDEAEAETFATADAELAAHQADKPVAHSQADGAPRSPHELQRDTDVSDLVASPEASVSPSSPASAPIPVVFTDAVTQAAYTRVVKTLRNKALLRYVDATSPWRNPLRWPSHVVPTKHPKANIMRCPEAPENPYLFQSQFVVPRADMYFRRPNVGMRKSSQKGKYESDRPMAFLVKNYTIPYFPDIVDTAMQPTPWAFLGSREAFFERSGGRQLGVRLLNHATTGIINPLSDNPAPAQPALAQEVQQLEAKRYGTSIAMLRPPGMAPTAPLSLPPHPPSTA